MLKTSCFTLLYMIFLFSEVESCVSSINISTVSYKGKLDISNSTSIIIKPVFTEKLLINCSFNPQITPAIDVLNSLVVLRTDVNKSDYQEVASITRNVGRIDFRYGEGYKTSVIKDIGESYLLVKFNDIDHELEGRYTCEAVGVSKTRKPQNCSSSAVVSLSEISLKHIMQILRLNLLKQKQIVDANNKLNATIHILKGRVDQFLDIKIREIKNAKAQLASYLTDMLIAESIATFKTYFFQSELYKGHRYYLSKVSTFLLPKLAQDTCSKYGGYLVEINDLEELNFLREFLNANDGITRYQDVLISGSDEKYEATFFYVRKNVRVTYFQWEKDQPDGGNQENCLSLQYNTTDWYFNDAPCPLNSTKGNLSYICEIEKPSLQITND